MPMDDGVDSSDLIRWTFAVPPAARAAVQTHLGDLGAEVFVRDDGTFHVLWEETDADLDGAVEAIWDLAGAPFEITQEGFQRLELHILHADDSADAEESTEFHPGVEPLDVKEL